jgi:hypothetical protein
MLFYPVMRMAVLENVGGTKSYTKRPALFGDLQ